MFKNVTGQKLIVFAFDATTGLPKTGDAANITAYVNKDYAGATVLGDTSATEIESTNAKGYYLFDLTQGETNADCLNFTGKSSTANIVVVGAPTTVYTVPPNFNKAVIDTSGLIDANVVKVGPTGAGTAQTARDIGASVLLSSGTGTGQLSLSAGLVTLAGVTHTGAVIPTVTTVTNQLTAAAIATGVWTDTTAGDFTTALSIGKSVMNGVTLGTGLTVASVSGAVGSVVGLTASNLDTTVSSRMATYTQPTGFLAATFPLTVASTTNITAGTITTATNVTTVNGLAAGVITASSIASDAITDAKVASDVTIASVTGSVGSVVGSVGSISGVTFPTNFSVLSISASTGLVDITQAAADKAWGTATRVLTAGTNIVLAKGTGVTGFNDLSAASVNAEVDTALADYDGPTNAEMVARTLATASYATAANQTTILSNLVGIQGATFDTATDSLEAIRNRGDAAWITATGFSTFNPASDIVAHVTLVDTTTTNTDMRGTNNAALAATALSNVTWTDAKAVFVDAAISTRLAASSYTAPDNTGIAAIQAKTDNLPSDPADQSILVGLIDDLPTNAELATALGTSDDATLAAVEVLRKLLRADHYIDTGTTPWALVYMEEGTGGIGVGVELFRKRLASVAGANLTSTDTVVGQAKV